MGLWLLPVLLFSLLLTIIFETAFAITVGIRNRKDLILIILINIVTNPIVVLSYYLVTYYTVFPVVLIIFLLEVGAILVEYIYIKTYGKEFRYPFLFSIGANVISYGFGNVIELIMRGGKV